MNNRIVGMRLTYLLLAIILTIYSLIQAREFLYPLAFGVLIAYLLYPIVNFLEKKGVPRILSILIPLLIAIVLVVFLAVFVVKRMNLFLEDMPYFREKAIDHINEIQKYVESYFNISAEKLKNLMVSGLFDLERRSGRVFETTAGTLFSLLMQPVFVFLFLFYRTKFAIFILQLAGRKNRLVTIKILREIATVVTRYMLGVTSVVIILCVFNSAGLLIIGIKYPLLFGVVSALFSFIPYFGNFIGGSIPFLFALLTEDSLTYAFRVFVFVYIIHFFENNILSPLIVGNNIRLNPFVIILGLIAGAMIWGIPGMLVTIPFLAMLNIIMKRIPGMQAYAYLMGPRGTRQHALSLTNIKRIIGRFKR